MRIRPLLPLLAVPMLLSSQALPRAGEVARVADSLARAFVASGGAPSVAIGIVRGDEIIAFAGYGMADLENDVEATAHSAYRIGSVTKQFTAAIVMQLVDHDSLGLEDPIAKYVEGLPAAWRPVTIHQLLNHTSGIPSYTDLGESWRRRWGEEMTPDTLIALTFGRPMDFAPGTKWSYDNTGYVLLGMVIEKVTGLGWGRAVEARLAGPLGLVDTRECLRQSLVRHRVRGYERDDDGWGNTPYLAMSQPYAAGALCSTVLDLARWNRALHTGKVVTARSYQLMSTPTGVAAANVPHYGFGLIRDTLGGVTVIEHGGGIHGFISGNGWVPSAELSVTALANSGSAQVGGLLHNLMRAALGKPLVQPATLAAVPLVPGQRERYVGVFALQLPGGARDFFVAVEGDSLTGRLDGQGANPLVFLGNDTFGMRFDPTLRIVFTMEGEQAVAMTLRQGDNEFQGRRKP